MILGQAGFAQPGVIRGTVMDAQTKKPIAKVNIFIQGTRSGTVSNVAGVFRLPDRFSAADTVVFSHIGYRLFKCSVEALRAHPTIMLH
ncbi:MAG: carboxypeptidase-like regulatory domain-containing protein, partial [Calditrichaeota bacterium]